jgi:hypothetical protein
MSSRHALSSRHASKSSSGGSKSRSKKTRSSPKPLELGSHLEELDSPQNYSASSYDEENDWAGSGDEYWEVRTRADSFDTKSLTESIRNGVVDGGLRYHAYHAGKYPFPNDEVEQERDEMKHIISITISDNKSFLAPIKDILTAGAEVLDLGKTHLLRLTVAWRRR